MYDVILTQSNGREYVLTLLIRLMDLTERVNSLQDLGVGGGVELIFAFYLVD